MYLGESKLFRQSADVFNMLVSIYGSKDLFVKEYRQLLAERLINDAWEKNVRYTFYIIFYHSNFFSCIQNLYIWK